MMEKPRKKKEKAKLEFEAGKVFDVKPAEEIKVDTEMSQWKSQKGEGGDRRA
jgi:hypothetical protein